MNTQQVVEAALFSAGRAVSVDEIAEQENLTKTTIEKAIKALAKSYDERDTVLEIRKAGAKWAMQVRTVAAEPAAKFAPMEIPAKVLKTLALIAYHQPIKQSDLKDMIGTKVYDHIPELKERGLVKTRRDGVTKILTVTQAFPEYFGLDAATPDQIRRVMAKLVGIDPDADRPRSVESFASEQKGDATETPSAQASEGAPGAADSQLHASAGPSTHVVDEPAPEGNVTVAQTQA